MNGASSGPRRFPRERFTKALVRLCERLEACSSARIDYRKKLASFACTGTLDVRVASLWAFGSWARGAAQCGDLDLLARLEGEWDGPVMFSGREAPHASPFDYDVCAKHLFGRRPPHVEIFDHREFSSAQSTIDIEDAVLIWAAGPHDWRGAIRSVKLNPAAGRMTRPHDEFPLTPLQLDATYRQVRELLLAREAGVLNWEFIPDPRGRNEVGTLFSGEQLELNDMSGFAGGVPLKSRALEMTRAARVDAWAEGVQWRFGQLKLDCGDFLRHPGIELFILAPRWSQAGPNGFLVVRKGPNQASEVVSEVRRLAAAQIEAEQASRR